MISQFFLDCWQHSSCAKSFRVEKDFGNGTVPEALDDCCWELWILTLRVTPNSNGFDFWPVVQCPKTKSNVMVLCALDVLCSLLRSKKLT